MKKYTKYATIGVLSLSIATTHFVVTVYAQEPATKKEAEAMSRQTQQEIKRTRQQIADNEAQVRKNLAELQQLEKDIDANRAIVTDMAQQVKILDGKIKSLSVSINDNEGELERMRNEYAKSVKKMRSARGRHSALAFIFSSKDFNQAARRMRYLREFNKWRQRQTDKINKQIGVLKNERKELDKARKEKDMALQVSRKAEADMKKQHQRQDEVVAELQRNGDALRTHLAEKQKEADALKNRISALIAEEQAAKAAKREARRKAEAEQQARAKAQAERIAREKAKAERIAREKAEAERIAREKAEAERKAREAKAQAERKAREAKAAEKKSREEKAAAQRAAQEAEKAAKKAQAEADRKAREASEKSKQQSEPSGEEYAKARGRKPRENQQSTTTSKGGFEAMKGSLPHPVSGSFRIVSQFGRHPLPDLPQVQYDNPGIDAEVNTGAQAQAVFAGKVSGVYTVPGYNTVVILNHGDYYTVYGNISSANVKVGDTVDAGHKLGALAKDPDNDKRTIIHFEVWHNREKQNPASWIR